MKHFFAALLLLLSGAVHAFDMPTFKATVELNRHAGEAPRFASGLFGGNLQWVENGDKILDDQGAWQTKMLNAVAELNPPVVRFPGGALASRYDWANGIGPVENRIDGLNFDGKPEPMRFGTDEFLELLSRRNAAGMITVNLKQDPAHNARWLEYINANKGKYSPAPEVPYWEIGNESYYNADPSFVTAKEYVKQFIGHYRALKAVDPGVLVGAILQVNHIGHSYSKNVIPELDTWNREVAIGLKEAGIVADFYGIHFYAPFDVNPNEQVNRQAILAAPVVFQDMLRQLEDELEKLDALAPMHVTEYGITLLMGMTTWKYNLDPVAGVYLGDMFLTFAQHGIRDAYYWTLLSAWCFGAYGDDSPYHYEALHQPWRQLPYTYRPSGQIILALRPYRDLPMLATTVKVRNLRFQPLGIVTDKHTVPIANALGLLAKDGSEQVILLAVNRSVKDVVTLTTLLEGKKLTPRSAELLAGDKQKGAPSVDSPAGTVNLPPMSLTAITLARNP